MPTSYIIGIYALFFVGIYFLIIRPNSKRNKQAKEMRDNVQVGDKIITIGGFAGRVRRVTEDELEVDFNGTNLKIKKWALSTVESSRSSESDTQ
ncbi:MAG TPA: preprotein translocase subunit YajC [Tissierellia bacterium]|jgi:preprotein translocase subunit YajC|nr:preprotein translocase subunit YajC [Tissierellia bacterium]